MSKLLLTAFFTCLSALSAAGQAPFSLSASPVYGFVIPHRPSMLHLVKSHVSGFEIDGSFLTDGTKQWHAIYKYPQYGFRIWHSDLGNDMELGSATGLITYFRFPLTTSERVSFGLSLGTGPAYISKKFDPEVNYKNVAIGSHINGILRIDLDLSAKINKHLGVFMRAGLTHFSNGGYKLPNLGINIPFAGVGISWTLVRPVIVSHPLSDDTSRSSLDMTVAVGLKEVNPVGGPKYPVVLLSAGWRKPLGRKIHSGIQADLFYNESLRYVLSDSSNTSADAAKAFRFGLVLPCEIMVSRVSLVFHVGAYVVNAYRTEGPVYQRIGLRYRVSKNTRLNFTLKLHKAKADNLEVGLVRSF